MNKNSALRYFTILIVLGLGCLYALPNLYPTQPAVQIAYTDSGKSADQSLLDEAEAILDNQASGYQDIFLRDNKIVVKFNTLDQQLEAKTALQNTLLDKVVFMHFQTYTQLSQLFKLLILTLVNLQINLFWMRRRPY